MTIDPTPPPGFGEDEISQAMKDPCQPCFYKQFYKVWLLAESNRGCYSTVAHDPRCRSDKTGICTCYREELELLSGAIEEKKNENPR